jgi:hypothetical protein
MAKFLKSQYPHTCVLLRFYILTFQNFSEDLLLHCASFQKVGIPATSPPTPPLAPHPAADATACHHTASASASSPATASRRSGSVGLAPSLGAEGRGGRERARNPSGAASADVEGEGVEGRNSEKSVYRDLKGKMYRDVDF